MQFLEQEITQVASTVWETVLGLNLVRCESAPTEDDRVVAGLVQVTGAWEGALTIETSADFARQAAATMFGLDPDAASNEDTQDAIGELTNMTGGNVKSLLPEPCQLSLPIVVQGRELTAKLMIGEIITSVAFECHGAPLVVRLHSKLGREGPMADNLGAGRREFSRVVVHLKAEVVAEGKLHRGGTMENLSLKGGFLRIEDGPTAGTPVDVTLFLEDTDITMQVQGYVVRAGPAGSAIQFTEIIGVDSLVHLRNLILFNSHDPNEVAQEFHSHLGLRRAN